MAHYYRTAFEEETEKCYLEGAAEHGSAAGVEHMPHISLYFSLEGKVSKRVYRALLKHMADIFGCLGWVYGITRNKLVGKLVGTPVAVWTMRDYITVLSKMKVMSIDGWTRVEFMEEEVADVNTSPTTSFFIL